MLTLLSEGEALAKVDGIGVIARVSPEHKVRLVDVRAEVTSNRRGVKSRELVLDAAERVMAEHGFEAATLARVVAEAGIPMSSVYRYFGSKGGILLAVMERGGDRFFATWPGGVGCCRHAPAPPGLPPAADRLRRALPLDNHAIISDSLLQN